MRMTPWVWSMEAGGPQYTGELGASSPGTVGAGPWSADSIAGRLPPPMHRAHPRPPRPKPLSWPEPKLEPASASLTAVGDRRSRDVFERLAAPRTADRKLKQPASKRTRGLSALDPEQQRRHQLVAQAIQWTPGAIRQAVLDAAKRTLHREERPL